MAGVLRNRLRAEDHRRSVVLALVAFRTLLVGFRTSGIEEPGTSFRSEGLHSAARLHAYTVCAGCTGDTKLNKQDGRSCVNEHTERNYRNKK
jgi:hypothetical protein